jgi:hypothetical protein
MRNIIIAMFLLKQFELENIMEINNYKCRILKYDTYNDLIEESYKNESTTTVFEAVGFTKFPYNICWYLEILPSSQFDSNELIEYNLSDFKIKIIHLNINNLETNELFNLRLKDNVTVDHLRNLIAQVI